MKITDISIKRSTIPVVIFVILVLAGVFSYFQLNKELAPSIQVPMNAIMTVYPGAAPSEVESSVSKKIEEAVSAMEGIDKITSHSFESVSLIQIEFKDGIDADLALQECERKVNDIKEDLPEGSRDSRFMKFDVNSFPIMSIAVYADIPDKEFFDIVDKDIKTRLQQVRGVASVDLIGGNEREIAIKVNAEKLEQYGMSLLQVQQVLLASNMDFPTGKIKNDETKYIIRLSGKFQSLDEIRNLVVGGTRDGSLIMLRDVASVVDGAKESTKIARINGKPAIGIDILKLNEGNAVDISRDISEIIDSYEDIYSDKNMHFEIASDTSEFTNSAINSVMLDLVFAIILVSVTMLLFLHTFRNLLFILISIPTSVVSTFLFFSLFGLSLNLLTLLALSIVIGAIVDDAIVVLENIYRHMEMGKSRRQASLDAIKEIGLTVTSITLVLVAVFLPIGLTSGFTGQLLIAFSLTIVVSILLSLLVSFTLVPLLTSRFGKLKKYNRSKIFDRFLLNVERFITWLKNSVLKGLNSTLAHKGMTIMIATILLAGSFFLIRGGFIQIEFLDQGDRGEFILSMELERTSTLEQTNATCLAIESKLLEYPEISAVYTKVGTSSDKMTTLETPFAADFVVKLVPKKERELASPIFAQKLKNDLAGSFAGPVFKVKNVNILGMTTMPVELYIRNNDLDTAIYYSNIIAEGLRSIRGTTDIQTSVENGDKELVVEFDREKLASAGLTIGEIGAQMFLAYEGNRDQKYTDGNNEYDIFIALDEFDRNSRSDLENITFTNRSGQLIKLSQVASITEKESPSTLLRYNKTNAVKITGNLIGITIGTVADELESWMEASDIPGDVDIVYAGEMMRMGESLNTMIIALIASVIFMYLIMVVLYNSYVYPMVVMLSLPLALIGGLLALALAGKTLSLFSIMGIIMLFGLVAKNAILVVDFANKLQEEGKKVIDAITEATAIRFRPILMTNLALIVGILPIALAEGPGAEWKTSLGWVLIGGLASSMVLSFLVVPVIYVLLDKLVKKGKKKPETDLVVAQKQ